MKKTLYLFTLIIAVSGCKDKYIWCEDIGQNVKPWSVYNLNDSISMHDQYGNASQLKISSYYNKPGYETKKPRGLMKKAPYCAGNLIISSENHYFTIDIESSGNTGKPDFFSFRFQLGDLFTSFSVRKQDNIFTAQAYDENSAVVANYTSGSETYPEALVFEMDTLQNSNSVYRFVYAKDKGLVEFSTRNPARTFTLD